MSSEMERALAADREKLIGLGADPGPTEEDFFGSPQSAPFLKFTNENGNLITITVEGPSSISQNTVTGRELRKLRQALSTYEYIAELEAQLDRCLIAVSSAVRLADAVAATDEHPNPAADLTECAVCDALTEFRQVLKGVWP